MEPPKYVTEIVLHIEQPAGPVDEELEKQRAEHVQAAQAARKVNGPEPASTVPTAEDHLKAKYAGEYEGAKEAMAALGIEMADPRITVVRVNPAP